jgi:class 3 adenylate cyclase/predicted ATPase
MRCLTCNAETAGGKFCGECGASLLGRATPESSKAERRHLTVLFCDLVGSTALSERLDPEDLRDVVQGYQSLCATIVRRHEGHVAQYLGDGLLVYFGYPTAHEDDARRAVRAGLEIVEAVQTVQAAGERLAVRVGIHSGLVVVGEIGEGAHREQLALGETPNFAHHVQMQAEPGWVVMSEATERLVRGFFRTDEMAEAATLKRVSRPLRLFRILGSTGATSRIEAASTTGLTPFVGRKAQVAALADSWARTGNGTRASILVRGEPGIGKSRLIEVVKGWIEPDRHDLLECRCSPYYENSALHPVIEMMERRFGFTRAQTADEKRQTLDHRVVALGLRAEEAVPLLAPLFSIPIGDHYPPLAVAPTKQRQRTLELLADCLIRLAVQRPTVFILEDLHWADPTTLELTKIVLNRQGAGSPVRLMVLLSARTEFQAGDLGHLEEMNLQPLPREESKTLVAYLTGQKALPDDVLGQLLARAGDIPLFVEELTKAILEGGSFRELDDRYELAGPPHDDEVPASIGDSLMARIDRLGESKPTAQLAATLGREFRYEVLKAVSSLAAAALERDLTRLVEAELVYCKGSPPHAVYTFKHALIRDAAYNSLLRKTRQEYHEQIARTLAHQFPELEDSEPELLARHYELAALLDEAIPHWHKAGERAMARAANIEAIAHLTRAVKLTRDRPPTTAGLQQELAIQLSLGPALTAINGWASVEVEAAFIRARDLATQLGAHDRLLAALWGVWSMHFLRGNLETALEAAEQVAEIAFATTDSMLHVLAHHALGFTRFFRGELAEALRHSEDGIAAFRPEQERAIVAHFQFSSTVALFAFRAASLWLLGHDQQAEEAMQGAMKLASELKHPPSLAFCLSFRAYLHFYRGEAAATWDVADRMLSLAREEGFLLWIPVAMIYRGWASAARGSIETGVAEMTDGFALFRKTGSSLTLVQIVAALGEMLWRSGRREEAVRLVEDGIAHARTHREHFFEAELHRLRGEILLDEASFNDALSIARQQHAKALELRILTSMARVGKKEARTS